MANTHISTVTISQAVQRYGPYEPSQPIRRIAHTYRRPGPRNNPTIEPGMLVCLIKVDQFDEYEWSDRPGIKRGIYNHPALILDVNGNNVKLLVVTSKSLGDRKPVVVMQHLPIYPKAPHPATGEQLVLSGGPEGDKMDSNSYVKVYQVYDLPRRILLKNVDKTSKRELRLSSESFEYVKMAVARYHGDTFYETSRPFPDFPEVVNFKDDGLHTPSIIRRVWTNPGNYPEILAEGSWDSSSAIQGPWADRTWESPSESHGYWTDPSWESSSSSQGSWDDPCWDSSSSSQASWEPASESQETSGGSEASLGGTGVGESQEPKEDGPSKSSDQRPDDGRPDTEDHGGVLPKPPERRAYIPPHRRPDGQRPTWREKGKEK